MSTKRPKTSDTLARNLRVLMKLRDDMSQSELAKRSGVSQSQISNILRGATGCSIENADALASVFNLQGWHLLIPSLPADLVDSPTVSSLVNTYIHADPEGRDTIDRIVSREKSRLPPQAKS